MKLFAILGALATALAVQYLVLIRPWYQSWGATYAEMQAAALAGRLPAAGIFELFLEQNCPAEQFRFGREANPVNSRGFGLVRCA